MSIADLTYGSFAHNVAFKTVVLAPATATQIIPPRSSRGDTVISIISGGPVSIGLDNTITANGPTTALVTSNRVVRTTGAIWGIATGGATIDVQEEY